MQNKLWFKAKRFGWGWTPITWQGWVLTLLYAAAIVQFGMQANNTAHSGSDFLIMFSVPFIITSTFFLVICYLKGEHPHWRWGK